MAKKSKLLIALYILLGILAAVIVILAFASNYMIRFSGERLLTLLVILYQFFTQISIYFYTFSKHSYLHNQNAKIFRIPQRLTCSKANGYVVE